MFSFNEYHKNRILIELEAVYGSIENFLFESADNIVNPVKFDQAVQLAKAARDKVNTGATQLLNDHLSHYGRSLYDDGILQHIHNDVQLHKERDVHLQYLKNLYHTNPEGYNHEVAAAQSRLPGLTPYGQNTKTKTMEKEKIAGKEVVVSVSNKGVAGSVAKIGKGGTIKMRSTCVNSKQSCRGEGADHVGATCLGMIGSFCYTHNRISNTILENVKTLKAPATNGAGYMYGNKKVAASPHLDYATLEYDSLVQAGNKARNLSSPNNIKLASFRQNTQNEQSAMHHDQILFHLPDELKPHIATNNYSAAIAKGSYDPNNPSHASTHDGVLHNTNFSIKGPDVVHDDKGKVVKKNVSGNLQDAIKALSPEVNEHGEITRVPQNAYVVAGGHSNGVLLRYPETKNKVFHVSEAPKDDIPFEKLRHIKTARIYTEVPYNPRIQNVDHPDGYGRETYNDPTDPEKLRAFEYQDYHVHANVPHPDDQGKVDFHTLNDNVGSDERKPNEEQIRKNKHGQVVGAIHISAPTNSTPNSNASGVLKTNRKGQLVGDDKGLANDPFVFPIQHHIDSDNPTRFNLNHPIQMMAAEVADKARKQVKVDIPKYEPHPQTKGELGEL